MVHSVAMGYFIDAKIIHLLIILGAVKVKDRTIVGHRPAQFSIPLGTVCDQPRVFYSGKGAHGQRE